MFFHVYLPGYTQIRDRGSTMCSQLKGDIILNTQNVFVIQFTLLIVFVNKLAGLDVPQKRGIKNITKNSFLEQNSMFKWTEINTGKETSLAFSTIFHSWIGYRQCSHFCTAVILKRKNYIERLCLQTKESGDLVHVRAGPISNRWFIIELRQTKIECLRTFRAWAKNHSFLRDTAQRIF